MLIFLYLFSLSLVCVTVYQGTKIIIKTKKEHDMFLKKMRRYCSDDEIEELMNKYRK